MATFGDPAMIFGASSPYARSGVLWDMHKRFYGTDDPHNLVRQAATRVMNPRVPADFVAKEFERDPVSAKAKYNAQFRSDVTEFTSLEILEPCVADGVYEIPPLPDVQYTAFVDPSGGSFDSFTMAIAHRESDRSIIVDCIRKTQTPFQPEAVVEDFSRTLPSYRIDKVDGDRYAGEWPREQFAKRGIPYYPSQLVKSDIYRDMLPLLNSSRVQLLDNKRLISQLHGLKRKTARGGKNSIDHGPGRHDDVANAVSGAAALVAAGPMPMTFHVPVVHSVPRSWDVLPVSAADYGGGSSLRPGISHGPEYSAGEIDAQFGWLPGKH